MTANDTSQQVVRQPAGNAVPRHEARSEPLSFSAVVPVRNAARTIASCLGALRAAGGDELQIVVVDDGSSDGSGGLARPFADTLIPSDGRGASGARNLGARHAVAAIIVFVDADVLVPPSAFTVLREVFASVDPPDAVQGVYAATCPQQNAASQYKNLYYHYSWTRRVRNPRLASAASFFLAIRREVFTALGGFDERIHAPTVEDADLGYRLVRSGGTIVLDARIQVVHDRRYGLAELFRYDCRLAAAKTRFMLRRVAQCDASVMHPFRGWAVSTARAAEMKAWLVSLGLLPVAALAAVLRVWPVVVAATAGILGLHFPFLAFVARERSLGLACKTACITFGDAAVVDVGIAWGVLSFLAGRRY